MFIDTHSHLNDEKFENNFEQIIASLKSNNISNAFVVGYDYKSSLKALEMAEKYENIYAIIGVHPEDWKDLTNECEEFLLRNGSNPKVVAIGEIGLDYHTTKEEKLEQKQALIKQLEIANKLNLPVSIHLRDATGDLMEIFKENKHLLNNGGVLHCFSESYEVYKYFKQFGFSVAFGGSCTFKNAKNVRESVKNIPLKDIILETDCPYLTPEPYRGKMVNESKFVNIIADKISSIKEVNIKEVEEVTNNNVRRIFPKFKG